MKKWLLLITCVIIFVFIASFLFPSHLNISRNIQSGCAYNAATRLIANSAQWSKWWPGAVQTPLLYGYKGFNYRINKTLLNSFEITIIHNTDSLRSSLSIVSNANDDVTQFNWLTDTVVIKNPMQRIAGYFKMKKFESNVKDVLGQMQTFFDSNINIYGADVIEQKVRDSSLIVVNKTLAYYPSVTEIYQLVDSLKTYITINHGEQTGAPMLNIYTDDSINYNVMVAIPTRDDLLSAGDFNLKRLVSGNILRMEVRGGIQSINNAQAQLKNYVNDHHKVSPAMPYQSLVTDRIKERDTAKWVTELYYPVFY